MPRQLSEDVTPEHCRTARARDAHRGCADVDAEGRAAPPVHGVDVPAGAAADVESRPGTAPEQSGIAGKTGAAPGCGVDRALLAVRVAKNELGLLPGLGPAQGGVVD